ncbi:hypothetical protein ABIC28_001604 [Rhodococcus sp. PvR044]|uniref:hypothetical protein n=1 Tax=Rhodococcus sp. PvR044 TaxID=3156402 RepID=UPI00339252D8
MEFTVNGEIWTPMLARRPAGTHFSESSTPGCKSPLVRNDDNKLATHAELSDGTKAAQGVLGVGVALGVALGVGMTVAAMKAAPHVKSGLVSLKSKLRRWGEDITDVEAPVPLTVVAEVEPEQPGFPRLRAV